MEQVCAELAELLLAGEVKFACVDGPDFDAHKIDFDEVINRTRIYKDQERKRDQKLQSSENKLQLSSKIYRRNEWLKKKIFLFVRY